MKSIKVEINLETSKAEGFTNELAPMIGSLFPFEDCVRERFIRRCFHLVGGPADGARDGISAALVPTNDALELLSALRAGELTGESFVAALSHNPPLTKQR